MSDKIYTALPPPDGLYDKNPQPPLTEREREMYNQVYNHFAAPNYVLSGMEKGQLTEDERFWLSYECILRFLRATKWKTPATVLRLEATLKWRREFGLYDLVTANHVEPEAVTGKEILFGHDTKGRPGFYMVPSRQNTDEQTRQVQFAVWMLERCIDFMPPGVENLDILINFADRAKNPSISTARSVLNILQDHYPERLGLSLIINVPFLVNAFFKIILPFVDPITRQKIKFNPQVLQEGIFTPDNLMTEWWGGARDFEYKHEKYWPELVRVAEERVRTWKERWRELGGVIGIREWDYKREKKEGETGEGGGENQSGTEVEGGTPDDAVGAAVDGDAACDIDSPEEIKDKGEPNGIHVNTHDNGLSATQATPIRTHSPWVVVDGGGSSGYDFTSGNQWNSDNGGGGGGGGGDSGGGSGGGGGGGDSGGGGGGGGD